jgi:hypothetical protein
MGRESTKPVQSVVGRFLATTIDGIAREFQLRARPSFPSQNNRDEIESYLPAAAEAAEFMARNWINPIPRPPTAPASAPNRSSAGKVSKSDFFFFVTVSPFSPVEVRSALF